MDYQILILIIGVILALLWTAKHISVLSIVIISFQLFSVISIFFNPTLSYYLYGASIFLALLYPFLNKNEKNKKYDLLILTIPLACIFVYSVFNFPMIFLIEWLAVVPVFFFFYAIFNYKKYKHELGFITVFFSASIMKLIELSQLVFTA